MSQLGLVDDPAPPAILAVDGGQTGLRIRAAYGELVAEAHVGGFAYPRAATPGASAAVVAELVEQAWSQLPAWARRTPPVRAAVGLTGDLGDATTVREIARRVGTLTGAAELRMTHDSVTAHLGAFAGEPGVVVAAGTGVVALGMTATGTHRRVDGWGHLLGDAGSGFAVGRDALRAVCAAADGRGPTTELSDVVERQFGRIDDLPDRLYRSDTLVSEVAALAAEVAAAAHAGDAVARAIWARAVEDLVTTTVAAAGESPQAPIRGVGGMFAEHELLERPWQERVRRRLPGCTVRRATAATAQDGGSDEDEGDPGHAGVGVNGAMLLASARQLGRWQPLLWYAGAPPESSGSAGRRDDNAWQ